MALVNIVVGVHIADLDNTLTYIFPILKAFFNSYIDLISEKNLHHYSRSVIAILGFNVKFFRTVWAGFNQLLQSYGLRNLHKASSSEIRRLI